MSEAWVSGLLGAELSLAVFAFEAAFIFVFRRSNTNTATKVVLGVFVVAFTARMVLLLAGPKLPMLGVHDGHAFGLGVVFSFLLALGCEAVFLAAKTKR